MEGYKLEEKALTSPWNFEVFVLEFKSHYSMISKVLTCSVFMVTLTFIYYLKSEQDK